MDERTVRELEMLHERICYALGDTKRIMILYLLSDGPRTVNDIAADLSLPQPTVSHHLKILRERRLVRTVREGTSVHYSLADGRVVQALDLLRGVLRDMLANLARFADATLSAPDPLAFSDHDEDDDPT